MQNKDGGWAAFDRDINREILTKVPFADHNAMLDPSCPDITARVLEALGQYRLPRRDSRTCRPGHRFHCQDAGSARLLDRPLGRELPLWHLAGADRLASVGYAIRSIPWCAGRWPGSRVCSNPAAAGARLAAATTIRRWRARARRRHRKRPGPCSALIAAGEAGSDEVRAGIDYLIATQQDDGSWQEEQFTGTGFPKVFYLKYHMYSLYFPLMALARYVSARSHERLLPFSPPHAQPETAGTRYFAGKL